MYNFTYNNKLYTLALVQNRRKQAVSLTSNKRRQFTHVMSHFHNYCNKQLKRIYAVNS